MWENSVSIRRPFGVSVFGSAVLRVSPDSATISTAVTRVEQKPSDAFSKARKASHAVAEFLRRTSADEFGMSRIALSQEFRHIGGENKFLGYKARIGFTVILKTLDRCEEVVTGLVDAGANEVGSIDFQTSRLKQLRAQVRGAAVDAAKEKATIYAAAAGVTLGSIIHIEDVNPQVLQGRGEGHVKKEPVIDDDGDRRTLDPGAIEVRAAVLLAYSLRENIED